jgi:uncharacterized protein with NRDE domain
MCTVVTLSRPGTDWPLLLAANRDEMLDRAWDPPAHHWPDRPDILAGRDRIGGGTWMGVNASGVVAAVLNRPGSLGPAPGKRSRGELPLLALAHRSAAAAAQDLGARDAAEWRGFNLVLADRNAVFFLRGLGEGPIETQPLTPGLHMVASGDADDPSSARIARHLPRFRRAAVPLPSSGEWHAWQTLLADSDGPSAAQLNVPPRGGFGTVCASLLALGQNETVTWMFAAGAPDKAAFHPVG